MTITIEDSRRFHIHNYNNNIKSNNYRKDLIKEMVDNVILYQMAKDYKTYDINDWKHKWKGFEISSMIFLKTNKKNRKSTKINDIINSLFNDY